MPLTFSHPAAVLPLKKLCPTYLDFIALALGSLLPDLGYFFFLFPEASFGHSIIGTLALDLPAGLAIYAAYSWVKTDKIAWAGGNGFPDFLKVAISLWFGALSHVIWDGFTHQRGVFGTIPLLNTAVVQVGEHSFALYKILQHLSSVFGFLVLVIYLSKQKIEPWRDFIHQHRALLTALASTAFFISIFLTRNIAEFEGRLYYLVLYFTDLTAAPMLVWGLIRKFSRICQTKSSARPSSNFPKQ